MIPEGVYDAVIVSHGLVKSSKKETPGIDFRLKLKDFDQVVTVTCWLSLKALGMTKRTLGSLGFGGGKISTLDPRHPQHASLKGRETKIRCKHEESGDFGEKEKWEFMGGGNEPASARDFGMFDDAFEGTYIASDEDVPY